MKWADAGRTIVQLPLARSVGYQIRMTNKLLQRALQLRIEQHGVTLGMWYFLRVLWESDGLTQSELSQRIGTMEPTALSAVAAMEKAGLVHRVRNSEDRRKINVFLTKKGRSLEGKLLQFGLEVVGRGTRSFSSREVEMMLSLLSTMQADLEEDIASLTTSKPAGEEP